MGHWQETCAITRTPIFEYNPVIYILPTEKGLQHPWFEDGPVALSEYVRKIYRGRYDNFGGIKERKRKREAKEAIFIHEPVWAKIVQSGLPQRLMGTTTDESIDKFYKLLDRQKKVGVELVKEPNDRELFREFYKVNLFAAACRINLPDAVTFRGTAQGDNHLVQDCYGFLSKMIYSEVSKFK